MVADTCKYWCDDCGIAIGGRTYDGQAAPTLYCPDCGIEMEYEWSWDNE